jgi:hypothetical protein
MFGQQLRKSRSPILCTASACGSRAIVISRPVIPRKSSAANHAGSRRLNLNGLNRDGGPGEKPTKDTAEQTAVEPSIASRARNTARGRKNWLPLRSWQSKKLRPNFHNPTHRARVIQIGQKNATQRSLLADDLAARWTGNSIPERLTKNTVALCATTLYVRQQLVSRGTTKRPGILLDGVTKMNHWLRLGGRSELQACDRSILVDSFLKLGLETSLLAEATGDFIKELQLP